MDAVSADDEQLVLELQRRFKPTVGGREPAPANLRAAITLARSPGCRPAEVFRQFSIPTGGSRSRVIDYRDRIVRDNVQEQHPPGMHRALARVPVFANLMTPLPSRR